MAHTKTQEEKHGEERHEHGLVERMDLLLIGFVALCVAMGSGTDVAQESANIVLLGDDLLRFVATVKIARRCRRIIMANFAGTLLVDDVKGLIGQLVSFLPPTRCSRLPRPS